MASMDLKKREVKPIFGFGNDLIVFRGNSGKVHVLYAYCPHLGANIGVGGTVEGEDIKCPFHGWTFNNEGKCISVPGIEALNTPKAEIKVWESIEVSGFIFVWNHSKGEKPNYVIEPIDGISNKYVFTGKTEFLVENRIQDINENVADITHFFSLHYPNPENIILKNKNHESVEIKGIFTSFKNIKKTITASWSLGKECHIAHFAHNFRIFLGQINSFSLFNVLGSHIGPAFIRASYDFLGKILIHSPAAFIHVEPNRVMMVHHYYTARGSILGYILCKIIIIFIRPQVKKDIQIWNNKRYVAHPYLSKNDHGIKLYRQWYQQFY